ncbi:lipopolysaccharide cholinephosphotransferase, partial [Francisella tularensis]
MSLIRKIKLSLRNIIHTILENKRNKFLKRNGLEVLKYTTNLLRDENIKHWIDGGTLLGIIRDKDFIVRDTDIDIGILIDRPDFLYEVLEKNNYHIVYYYVDQNNKKFLIRAEIYNVGIDFEIFFETKEFYYYDSPRQLTKLASRKKDNQYSRLRFKFDKSCINNLSYYQFNDINLPIPSDLEKYFSVYYKSWNIPVNKKKYLKGYFHVDISNYKHHNNTV